MLGQAGVIILTHCPRDVDEALKLISPPSLPPVKFNRGIIKSRRRNRSIVEEIVNAWKLRPFSIDIRLAYRCACSFK